MDYFYQITISKGGIDDNGEKVEVEYLMDDLTRLPDKSAVDEEVGNIYAKVTDGN